MLKKITKHLSEQNETYFQHMWNAWKIIALLKKLEAKCFIHSVFPFCYADAISSKIKCLEELTKRGNGNTEKEEQEELYEVYGGD